MTPPRVGFLSNFLAPADLGEWEPGLSSLSPEACERFLDRSRGMLEPFEVARPHLRSAAGTEVEVVVFAVPFTPEQAARGLRSGDVEWARALVRQGVEMARNAGCTLVGFGGYTSIVTNACRDIVASDIGLTSGNSLTSAAALDALFHAADEAGVRHRRLAVVGGAGNIGLVLAEAAASEVDEILLVGRENARPRLEAAASALARSAPAPVRVATRMEALRECTLVLAATSAPRPVILPEHLSGDPVVLVDVAVPGDVHPDVATARPRAVVLNGGVVRAPLGQRVTIPGMRLDGGEIYGCLAETALLGLAGIREHFSYGPITAQRVRRIRDLARTHGFTVSGSPRFNPADHGVER